MQFIWHPEWKKDKLKKKIKKKRNNDKKILPYYLSLSTRKWCYILQILQNTVHLKRNVIPVYIMFSGNVLLSVGSASFLCSIVCAWPLTVSKMLFCLGIVVLVSYLFTSLTFNQNHSLWYFQYHNKSIFCDLADMLIKNGIHGNMILHISII